MKPGEAFAFHLRKDKPRVLVETNDAATRHSLDMLLQPTAASVPGNVTAGFEQAGQEMEQHVAPRFALAAMDAGGPGPPGERL